MKKTLLLLAVSLLVPSAAIYAENTPPTSPAPLAGKRIELKTKSLELVYQADGNGRLNLEKVGSLDGSWTSPLKGPLFPSTPCHDENGPRYISPISIVTADGSNGMDLRYESHSSEIPAPGVEHLTITLQDRVQAITVELHIRAYGAEDTIEQWLVLKNKTGKPIQVPRLSSLYFQADAKQDIHLEWYASNEHHTAGEPFREKLSMGARVLESRDGNRHKAGPIPAFILGFGAAPTETTVPCMIVSFEWPGSTRFSFEINEQKILEASVEVNQSQPPVVEDGESMASPRSMFTFSKSGMGEASRNLHRWTRTHLLPDGNRLRLIDNNSWEGCSMDVSENAVLKMMEDSANLGIELYVLDDGWFGNGAEARTSPRAGLGDWQFNKDRFPQGLDNIMKAAKKMGIEFGIWFEPEMVNPKSKLFQSKPEWVMRNPGHELALQRGQAALDVANPDVQEFMFASVNDLLTTYPGIRFVKWDCNSNINNPYSPYLGPGRQGNMLNAYNNGYLGVMRRLVEAHPEVDFQACAAGGGRANYGAMRYSQTFWPSDATDPRYRLQAQWNFSRFMPPLAITAHVTHAGGESLHPKFRFDVSMMCQLGMEVDTRKSTLEYLAAAKTGIAAYKQVREIVQLGDQYRHAHPSDSPTPSMNFVSRDLKKALVLAYQIGSASKPISFTAPVSGLDPNVVYEAVEINLPKGDAQPRLAPGAERRQTGAAWMKNGIPLVFTRQCDSAAIVLDSKLIPEPHAATQTEGPVTRLYVFGDSYSDNGAGYVDGNGPTAVVYLSRKLGFELIPATEPGDAARSLNFAVSGAQTGSGPGRKIKEALLGRGIMDQVEDFVARVQEGSVAFDPKTTLFFLAGGLNDGKLPGAETVANLENQIRKLYAVGARRFRVALMPEEIPDFKALGVRLNPELRRIPEEMRSQLPDARIALSNWGAFFDEVMKNPARYGIQNTKDKCAGRALFNEDATPCADPATYFYYHEGHPSTAVHKVVGDKLYEELGGGR